MGLSGAEPMPISAMCGTLILTAIFFVAGLVTEGGMLGYARFRGRQRASLHSLEGDRLDRLHFEVMRIGKMMEEGREGLVQRPPPVPQEAWKQPPSVQRPPPEGREGLVQRPPPVPQAPDADLIL